MDVSRNSARNELKEFSLKFINVLVNILVPQWSRNDEGENGIDSNNKAVEHSLWVLSARRLVRGGTARPGLGSRRAGGDCPPATAALSPLRLCWKRGLGAISRQAHGKNTRAKENPPKRQLVFTTMRKGGDGCKTVTKMFQKRLLIEKQTLCRASWKLSDYSPSRSIIPAQNCLTSFVKWCFGKVGWNVSFQFFIMINDPPSLFLTFNLNAGPWLHIQVSTIY